MNKGVVKIVFTVCIVISVIFAYGQGATGTPITIDSITASPGDTVTISVIAGTGGFTGIGSTDFEIHYPTTYLNATTVTNGGFLSSFTPNINDGLGKVTAGSINLSGDNVAAGASFFDITFDIAAGAPPGVYTLDFITADLTTTLLPYPPAVIATEMVDGSITVSGAVVPEPATILLLGMGFLGITGYMRKRNGGLI